VVCHFSAVFTCHVWLDVLLFDAGVPCLRCLHALFCVVSGSRPLCDAITSRFLVLLLQQPKPANCVHLHPSRPKHPCASPAAFCSSFLQHRFGVLCIVKPTRSLCLPHPFLLTASLLLLLLSAVSICSTTLEFFSFANPLSRADMNQWANYGGTASSRMLGQNVTLVVRAEPESKKH
jgi:hypothetical protein